MSQENVELVRGAVDAFNRRDFETLAEVSHPEIEFVSVLTAVEGATYRGADTWPDYFERMDDAWQDWRVEDLRISDPGGDEVVGVIRIVGTGRHSGVPVEREIALTYRIRNGRIWRMHSYLDPEDAFRSVGLRA